MLSKTFVLVAGATSVYAACSLTPGAGAVQLPANSIYAPDGTDSRTPTKGVPFSIIYDGSGLGPTLDFVLVKGPGNNVIPQGYVATGVENCGTTSCTFSWTPDCSLEDTAGLFQGYGIRMDDESTCKYQYTTQFGIKAGDVCGSKPSSATPPKPSSTEGSKPSGSASPPKPSGSYPGGDHPQPPKPSSSTGGSGGSHGGSGSGYGSGSGSDTGSTGGYGGSGNWSPPKNGTVYNPSNTASNSTKPTYTPVYSNNAAGRFAINAAGAIVALAVSAMLL